jgi:hypothetical protein
VAQDSELRHLARKYVKEYALLDTLGNAQENAENMRKLVKIIHQHADAMKKETAVESPMLDVNEVRQYIIFEMGDSLCRVSDQSLCHNRNERHIFFI